MSPSQDGTTTTSTQTKQQPGRKKCKLHQLRPTPLTPPSTNGPQKLPTTFQTTHQTSCFAFSKLQSSKAQISQFFDTLAGWLPHLAIPNSMQCIR